MMSEAILVRECPEKTRGDNKAAAAAQPRDVGPGEHRVRRRPKQKLLAASRAPARCVTPTLPPVVAVFVSWSMHCWIDL
jgi:hypothetical protein